MDGQRLKGLIIGKGLMLRDIAKQVGIKPATLSLKLNGRLAMRVSEANQIAKAANLTRDEIINVFFKDVV